MTSADWAEAHHLHATQGDALAEARDDAAARADAVARGDLEDTGDPDGIQAVRVDGAGNVTLMSTDFREEIGRLDRAAMFAFSGQDDPLADRGDDLEP
ncbi:hypothetical protein [uncultured Jannaschia sp.]|uniref:hypothetical protein n=1 Tax=uncultured Jannaschia sp. TaxID=293347 RepID=UPI002625932A|nr:hypothetical protein [uncultured Jannaschia sp.]